jgi:hypothetical protein
VLLHTSGEWISSTFTIPVLPQVVAKGQDPVQSPQGYGSALTYALRYALAAIVGIAPDDDDGNAASFVHPAPQKPPRAKLNRDAALARIANLGGDVDYAETLSDDALVAYGQSLKHQPEPEPEPELHTARESDNTVTVSGIVTGIPYISEKVCKFSLADENSEHPPVAVFPQRTCWHQVVNSSGKFTIADDEVVTVTGKLKHDDKYGDSIIADTIEFIDS